VNRWISTTVGDDVGIPTAVRFAFWLLRQKEKVLKSTACKFTVGPTCDILTGREFVPVCILHTNPSYFIFAIRKSEIPSSGILVCHGWAYPARKHFPAFPTHQTLIGLQSGSGCSVHHTPSGVFRTPTRALFHAVITPSSLAIPCYSEQNPCLPSSELAPHFCQNPSCQTKGSAVPRQIISPIKMLQYQDVCDPKGGSPMFLSGRLV
jgi:hypothetical protein